MRRRWSSGAGRPDGVEVELVEWHDDGPMGSEPSDGGPRPGELTSGSVGPGPSRGRRAVRWGAGLAAVLLLVVVVNVVEARRDAVRAAAFEGIAGLVAPMPEPLTEIWRHPGGRLVGEVDGQLLVTGIEGGVTALDLSTGDVRWSWTGTSEPGTGWCGLEPLADRARTSLSDLYAAPVPDAGSWVVLCSRDGAGTVVDDGADASTGVTLIDPATGAELFTVDAPGEQLGTQVVAGGLIVTTALPDRRVRFERWDLSTGEPSWALTSVQPVVAADGSVERYEVIGDVLLLAGESSVAVSLRTGQEVDPASVSGVPLLTLAAEIGDAAATWDVDQDGSGSGRVTNADGSVRFELPGPLWTVPPATGPGAEVLLVGQLSGGVAGLDLRTGDELWSLPGSSVVLVIDDLVLVTDGQVLSALRLADGVTVWAVDIDPQFQITGVTDGDAVLVAILEGGLSHLVALDLSDGHEVWRSDERLGGALAVGLGGRVVVQMGGQFIGMG